jgi:nickel-dependent lactate racemase
MTPEEITDKFGEEVVERVVIKNHRFRDPENLIDLGTTKNGTPISVNKEVFEADFKIGVGSIVPHHIPGFSGGAKIIQPGVCGESTTGATHLLSVNTRRSYLGIEDNIVRRELNEIAVKVGLNTIFNTVLDRNGRIVKAFFGDVVKAFLAGVQVSREVYAVYLPQPADIVLASSHPCDIEFWQAHKTLYAADSAVKEGGISIVVTPCPEGVAKTHMDMIEYAGKTPDIVREMLKKGEIKDSVAAALAIAWGQIREREDIYLVSGGISSVEAKKLGFVPFESVTEALKKAIEIKGRDAKIAVLTHAPDMLPIIRNNK